MTRATPGYSNGGGEKGAESGCNFTVELIGFPPEKNWTGSVKQEKESKVPLPP